MVERASASYACVLNLTQYLLGVNQRPIKVVWDLGVVQENICVSVWGSILGKGCDLG